MWMQLRVMLEQCMRRICVYDASESGRYHKIGSIAREMSVCGADQCLTKPPPYRHRRPCRRRRFLLSKNDLISSTASWNDQCSEIGRNPTWRSYQSGLLLCSRQDPTPKVRTWWIALDNLWRWSFKLQDYTSRISVALRLQLDSVQVANVFDSTVHTMWSWKALFIDHYCQCRRSEFLYLG